MTVIQNNSEIENPKFEIQKYLLVINGRPEGPFSILELKERQIRATDFVKADEMPDYKEAHEVPELRQLFGFAKQAVIPQYFAGFDQRVTAAAIDWLIVTGFCVIPVLITVILTPKELMSTILSLSLFILIPLCYFIYHMIMESSSKQGTHGKQILKIKVCDMNGEPLTPAHAAGRNLAKVFSVLTLFAGYLIAFFNKKQQCLHDMIAGTLVMKDRLV